MRPQNSVINGNVIFGQTPSPFINRHLLQSPSPQADDVICEWPLSFGESVAFNFWGCVAHLKLSLIVEVIRYISVN